MKLKIIQFTGMMLLLNGCISNPDYVLLQSSQDDKNTTVQTKVSAKSIEYKILPQDRLSIALYKDPAQSSDAFSNSSELGQQMNSKGILVDSRGYISLPMIGKVKVSGLSQTQASKHITTKYKQYLNTPTVYLEVLNKHVFVLGEVNKPGVIDINNEKITLFEALAYAGDFTDAAVRNKIVILSNDKRGNLSRRTIDLTNFDKLNYASLMLRPNDVVYVEPSNWKQFRVQSNDITSPFTTAAKVASPFVTLKYLTQ